MNYPDRPMLIGWLLEVFSHNHSSRSRNYDGPDLDSPFSFCFDQVEFTIVVVSKILQLLYLIELNSLIVFGGNRET